MLVRWTQPAADDLLHICDYTAERFGTAQARRVADAIYESAYSKDVVRKVFHEEREISRQHPLPMSYKTMEVLEKAWAEVQAKCAYLAVLK
jgi:hypothetical protein